MSDAISNEQRCKRRVKVFTRVTSLVHLVSLKCLPPLLSSVPSLKYVLLTFVEYSTRGDEYGSWVEWLDLYGPVTRSWQSLILEYKQFPTTRRFCHKLFRSDISAWLSTVSHVIDRVGKVSSLLFRIVVWN